MGRAVTYFVLFLIIMAIIIFLLGIIASTWSQLFWIQYIEPLFLPTEEYIGPQVFHLIFSIF